jgi:hypothetical protein
MTEEHIRLIYDGPAVEDGEMDIAQLAPSLLAFGKLVESFDALASGEMGRVRVKVRADVRRGSFDVGIALSFLDSAKAWLISPDGIVTTEILALLGLSAKDGVVGLIQAVRWLKGRRVNRKMTIEDGNTVLEVDDGQKLEVPPAVGRAVDDVQVRQHLERFTEPLREDGIDQIKFEGSPGEHAEKISQTEAKSFEATAGADPTSQARFVATYQIKRLYFEQGKKWRLSNGAQTILAQIEDQEFWRKVELAEASFSSNDYLVCEVRMDQWLSETGLKTEYVVEKVQEHIPAPKQSTFLE